MSEKKVVRRSVAIALGIICIIFIAGLGGVMAYYSTVVNDKNTTYGSYASSHSHTNSEFNALNSTYQGYTGTYSHTNSEYDGYVSSHTHSNSEYDNYVNSYNNYVGSHHYTDDEYNSLLSNYNSYIASHHYTDDEYNALTKPWLTTVGLSVTNFNKYWSWDSPSHLTISSYVFNMGTDTAYKCKFHVKVWSSDNALLLDTTVDLGNSGTISGRGYVYKSAETPYTGSGSYWSVVLEFANTP